MALQEPIVEVTGEDAAGLFAFVFGFATAIAAARLSTRTRYFSDPDELPTTWHGRRVNRDDGETYDGFNPTFVFYAAFLGSTFVYYLVIHVLFVG